MGDDTVFDWPVLFSKVAVFQRLSVIYVLLNDNVEPQYYPQHITLCLLLTPFLQAPFVGILQN